MTMPYDDAGTSRVTRFEVFTGAGRRRDWPPKVKASILAESFSGQETVCSVARRHGMSPSQLFTWRRQLRKQMENRNCRAADSRHQILPFTHSQFCKLRI